MGHETAPGDSHGRCGGNVSRQTVPDTSSGDRKSSESPTVDSRVRLTISDEDETERSCDVANESQAAELRAAWLVYFVTADSDVTSTLRHCPPVADTIRSILENNVAVSRTDSTEGATADMQVVNNSSFLEPVTAGAAPAGRPSSPVQCTSNVPDTAAVPY